MLMQQPVGRTDAERGAPPEPPQPRRYPAPGCHRVLVVDDDDTFARTVADALVDRDIDALAVHDPREALSLARRTPFAAAVVDLIMPEMDGLELARELRRSNPATEVVMLTGHGDMHSAIEGIRNELFDYLQKDALHTPRLRRAVRAAIARSELGAENRRLMATLKESTRKLRVLTDVSARLSAQRHLDELLEELTRSARELLEGETSRVLLMDRNDLGDMTIRTAFGGGEVALGGHFASEDGIAMRVAATGRAVRLDRAADHPSYSPRCDEMRTALPGFLCVPLRRPSLFGALTIAGRSRPFSEEDLALAGSLGRQGAIAIEGVLAHEANENFFTHASAMLVSLLDSQDRYFFGHSRNVALLADMVSRGLGLSEEERRTIHFAALLHDVGKLRLGPDILASTRRLTTDEMGLMRQHPALGVEILRPVSRWESLAPIIHAHHERWDGRGYPRGLAGEAIPLGGRIVAVAEAFDAMTRTTPHRVRRTEEEALTEVQACAGSQFDPAVASVFVEEYRKSRPPLRVAGD